MATVTIYPTVDAFLNNISGFYPAEDFILVDNSSSSSGNQSDGLWQFPAAGLLSTDTINSVTLNLYCSFFDDFSGGSAVWNVFTDINRVWGNIDGIGEPPTGANISVATVGEGALAVAVGWLSKALTTTIPKNTSFNVGIECGLDTTGPADAYFDSIENTSGRKAYIVINYTPLSGVPTRTLTGVGL